MSNPDSCKENMVFRVFLNLPTQNLVELLYTPNKQFGLRASKSAIQTKTISSMSMQFKRKKTELFSFTTERPSTF
jgi:hypothetical protein